MGAFANFGTEATDFEKKFPGITNTLLTLNSNFRLPLNKEYLQACGLASVSRRSCEALLYSPPIPFLMAGATVQAVQLPLWLGERRSHYTRDQV